MINGKTENQMLCLIIESTLHPKKMKTVHSLVWLADMDLYQTGYDFVVPLSPQIPILLNFFPLECVNDIENFLQLHYETNQLYILHCIYG